MVGHAAAAFAGTVLLVAAMPLGAQQPPARAAGPRQTCSAILTDAEVEAAIGRAGAAAEKVQTTPGDSTCRWTWADTGSTVTASFSDAGAIADNAAGTKCCPQSSTPVVAVIDGGVVDAGAAVVPGRHQRHR